MQFTDSHCHLFKEYYKNIDKVLKDAYENDVVRYISDADNIESSYEMLNLAKAYDNVFVTLGIHPEHCFDDVDELDRILNENKNNKKIVAIGEIGLDYYYGKESKDKQIEIFDKQLSFAEKYNLPVVVHSREATKDTLDTIKRHKVKGVIHCFSGSLETALEYIDLGFLIGVGGVMTFKNAKIKDVIRNIPLNKLVLETDAPYLAPEPYRGKQNEPKYIKTIASYLASVKGVSLDTVSITTEDSIEKLFFA